MIQEKPNMMSSGLVPPRCAIRQYAVVDLHCGTKPSSSRQTFQRLLKKQKDCEKSGCTGRYCTC